MTLWDLANMRPVWFTAWLALCVVGAAVHRRGKKADKSKEPGR